MAFIRKKVDKVTERYDDSQSTSRKVLNDPMFKVGDKVKSEFDMWAWIFTEISNIRLEVSRLGSYVRINTKTSPQFLDVYHSQIMALLLPISVVIPDNIWKKIDNKWLEAKTDIINFNKQRKVNPNKKIPFELIRKLDTLYRVALLAAQKAGLGIRTHYTEDIDKAIETSITGT